jgi:hypothetical protein
MANLIIITSVINIPNNPFSYTSTRSVYSREERFEQTKNTINSIRAHIPHSKILISECSDLNEDEINYLNEHVDYFLNLYGNEEMESKIFGLSKSLGENTLILSALEFIDEHHIEYENLYKVSGRYWINQHFNYDHFNNNKVVYVHEKSNKYDVFTSFYKLNVKHVHMYKTYIACNEEMLNKCMHAEIFFGLFLEKHIEENDKLLLKVAGISGLVAVYNNYYIEY